MSDLQPGMNAEHCPICHRMPHKWIEPARFKSSQVFWVGCQKDGVLEGGKSAMIATFNWNRKVLRVKYDMEAPR